MSTRFSIAHSIACNISTQRVRIYPDCLRVHGLSFPCRRTSEQHRWQHLVQSSAAHWSHECRDRFDHEGDLGHRESLCNPQSSFSPKQVEFPGVHDLLRYLELRLAPFSDCLYGSRRSQGGRLPLTFETIHQPTRPYKVSSVLWQTKSICTHLLSSAAWRVESNGELLNSILTIGTVCNCEGRLR